MIPKQRTPETADRSRYGSNTTCAVSVRGIWSHACFVHPLVKLSTHIVLIKKFKQATLTISETSRFKHMYCGPSIQRTRVVKRTDILMRNRLMTAARTIIWKY